MNPPQVPALDYERAKDFFYEKLAADRHGRGRMESAYFHTAQFVFQQGIAGQAELLQRIAELEATVRTLRLALQATGEETARMLYPHDRREP